ncbi:MAG TPA: hypothetical protein PKA47_17315, partial [Accumulibacter sp.]|nr:hypothetical protein [Accumulibacter sp.]
WQLPRWNTVYRGPTGKRKSNQQQNFSAVSDGPLLYLKLPPGSYQIAAQIDGIWQSQHVQAGAPGNSAEVSFVAKAK